MRPAMQRPASAPLVPNYPNRLGSTLLTAKPQLLITPKKKKGKRDDCEIRLRYQENGPIWYSNRLGTIGINNLKNYPKRRSRKTWTDRSWVVRPYMKGTTSSTAAYIPEPNDPEIDEAFAEWLVLYEKEEAKRQEEEVARAVRRKEKEIRRSKERNPRSLVGQEQAWRGGGGGTPQRGEVGMGDFLRKPPPVDLRPAGYGPHQEWVPPDTVDPGGGFGHHMGGPHPSFHMQQFTAHELLQKARRQAALAAECVAPLAVGSQGPPDFAALKQELHQQLHGAEPEEDPEEIFSWIMANIRQKANAAAKRKPGQALDLQAVFAEYDEDGSGTIDKEELAAVLKQLEVQVDEATLETVFRYFDKDGAGVEYGEFAYAFYNQDSVVKSQGSVRMRSPAFRWLEKTRGAEGQAMAATSPTGMTKQDFAMLTHEADYFCAMGWFSHAVKRYTDALPHCPLESAARSLVLANRSAAFEGLLDYESALDDAHASMAEHGKGFVGHLAEGNALTGLRYFEQAVVAYRRALTRAPGHPEIQLKYERVLYMARGKKYGTC